MEDRGFQWAEVAEIDAECETGLCHPNDKGSVNAGCLFQPPTPTPTGDNRSLSPHRPSPRQKTALPRLLLFAPLASPCPEPRTHGRFHAGDIKQPWMGGLGGGGAQKASPVFGVRC